MNVSKTNQKTTSGTRSSSNPDLVLAGRGFPSDISTNQGAAAPWFMKERTNQGKLLETISRSGMIRCQTAQLAALADTTLASHWLARYHRDIEEQAYTSRGSKEIQPLPQTDGACDAAAPERRRAEKERREEPIGKMKI